MYFFSNFDKHVKYDTRNTRHRFSEKKNTLAKELEDENLNVIRFKKNTWLEI